MKEAREAEPPMRTSRFSEAQIAFVLKQMEEEKSVGELWWRTQAARQRSIPGGRDMPGRRVPNVASAPA